MLHGVLGLGLWSGPWSPKLHKPLYTLEEPKQLDKPGSPGASPISVRRCLPVLLGSVEMKRLRNHQTSKTSSNMQKNPEIWNAKRSIISGGSGRTERWKGGSQPNSRNLGEIGGSFESWAAGGRSSVWDTSANRIFHLMEH